MKKTILLIVMVLFSLGYTNAQETTEEDEIRYSRMHEITLNSSSEFNVGTVGVSYKMLISPDLGIDTDKFKFEFPSLIVGGGVSTIGTATASSSWDVIADLHVGFRGWLLPFVTKDIPADMGMEMIVTPRYNVSANKFVLKNYIGFVCHVFMPKKSRMVFGMGFTMQQVDFKNTYGIIHAFQGKEDPYLYGYEMSIGWCF